MGKQSKELKETKEMMQAITEIIAEDMRKMIKEGEIDSEIQEVVEDEMKWSCEVMSEEEVRERVLEYAKKCEGVVFSPYIEERVQKQFFCLFEGQVLVLEEHKEEDGLNKIYYTKWYKKGGASYYIGWLTVGVIKSMMRQSIKAGRDLILMMIKDFKDAEKEEN